jgi:acetyl esterase/lipase
VKRSVVRLTGIAAAVLVLASAAQAQKVIRLYEGAAPGSESWNQQEKEYFSKAWNTQVVTNVTVPTLTVYAPDAGAANGTGVVICPGGGFLALSINSEGIDVAKWLAAKGVTAFVLKYRLFPTGEDGTTEFMTRLATPKKLEEVTTTTVPLAVADATAAVSYVRKHAAEFGVSPTRIGLMGFSAGGTITGAVAFGYTAESRPDFVAPIYAYMGAVKAADVPNDAPPMFIAAASDDQLGLAPDSVHLYEKSLAAKKPVELHMYSKGGHGFGMRKQELPSDHWIERFGDWLRLQGLLTK